MYTIVIMHAMHTLMEGMGTDTGMKHEKHVNSTINKSISINPIQVPSVHSQRERNTPINPLGTAGYLHIRL